MIPEHRGEPGDSGRMDENEDTGSTDELLFDVKQALR